MMEAEIRVMFGIWGKGPSAKEYRLPWEAGKGEKKKKRETIFYFQSLQKETTLPTPWLDSSKTDSGPLTSRTIREKIVLL